MGPLIMLLLILLEVAAYFFHLKYPFSLNLTRQTQILITIPLVLIFITGYLSFLLTYRKHSVGKKVIKSGPYRLVRHPLYAADIFTLSSIAAVWFNSIAFVVAWLILLFLLHFIVKPEEKYMEKKFGEEYLQYKRKVPSILPYKGFVKL